MIKLSLENIEKYLASIDVSSEMQEESNQLYSLRKYGGYDFPLFFRVYDEETLLQMLLFFPVSIKTGCESNLARLLLLINKEIDLPGFGMDESAGVVFYRLMIPSYEKKLQKDLIGMYLNAQEGVCKTFMLPIMAVAQGKMSYQTILKQLKNSTANV